MTDITDTAGNGLKNYAYNILKKRLINCTHAPGSIPNEAHLASEMKLSRILVREAISRLEIEELVKAIPKKEIHATDILLSDVLQISQVRTEFEPTILRLSASRLPRDGLLYFIQRFENLDPDDTVMNWIRLDTVMHLFITERHGNRYTVGIMYRVYDASSRIILFIHWSHAAVHDDSGENLEILKLLLNRGLETATEKMCAHMEYCRMTTLNYFYTVSDGRAPIKTYRDKLYRKQETAPHPYR